MPPACRLYATRPSAPEPDDTYEPVARDFLALSLWIAIDAYRKIAGPLKAWWPKAISLDRPTVGQSGEMQVTGVVTWAREPASGLEERPANFTVVSPLPTGPRIPRSIQLRWYFVLPET